jgi:hypothetical protein
MGASITLTTFTHPQIHRFVNPLGMKLTKDGKDLTGMISSE